jgi:hypothetical protein
MIITFKTKKQLEKESRDKTIKAIQERVKRLHW